MTHAPQHYVRFFIPVVRHSAFPASWQAGARGTGRRVQPMPGLQVSSRCFQVRTSPCTRALEAAEAPPTGGPWTAPRPAGPSCSSCNLQPLPARTEQAGDQKAGSPWERQDSLGSRPPCRTGHTVLGTPLLPPGLRRSFPLPPRSLPCSGSDLPGLWRLLQPFPLPLICRSARPWP